MTVTTAVLERARSRPNDIAVVTETGETTLSEFAADIRRLQRGLDTARLPPLAVVPVRDADPVVALETVLAIDGIDRVPLLIDSRWTTEHATTVLAALGIPGASAERAGWGAFSSGSTGQPRVILRGRDSWLDSFEPASELLELTAADAVLIPVSLVSSLSMFAAMHALHAGCTVAVPGDGSDSALASVLPTATVTHTTPMALLRILDLIDLGLEHRLRVALIGGAPISEAQRARAAASGIRVVSYYGAAELSFVAVDSDGHGLRPFPGVEVRFDPLADSDLAELRVRSPYLADGYLGAGGGALHRDADGWASVGDLVTIPAGGAELAQRLELRGRRDGAILTAGATVVPEDVESVVRNLPGIRDAVVFGVPHERLGAIVCVVVETSDAADAAERAAWRADCRRLLTIAQQPRRWYTTPAFVRTPAGKPARASVIAIALMGADEVARRG